MKPIAGMSDSELERARLDRAPPFEEWVWDSELLVYKALPPLSRRAASDSAHPEESGSAP